MEFTQAEYSVLNRGIDSLPLTGTPPYQGGEFLILHTAGAVGHHLLDNLTDHLLQLVNKLVRVVFMRLNVTQFLLPLTCKLSTLQQFLIDDANEGNARGLVLS